MKTLTRKFSTAIKTVVVLTLVLSYSCGKDDAEAIPFVTLPNSVLGQYTGSLSYTPNSGEPTFNNSGTATISATGDKVYQVTFSDGVPPVTDLRFINTNGEYKSADINGNTNDGTTIQGNELSVSTGSGVSNSLGFTGTK